MVDKLWRGWSSGIRWVLVLIFIFSLITWAIGCAFTARLANAELASASYARRTSTTEIYFYAAALPMATMLAAAIDLFLYSRGWLNPVVSIIWSIIAHGVWLFILVAWGVTEWSPDTGGFLKLYYYSFETREYLYGSGLFYGRIVTGSIAATLALVQMSFAARAVDLERKERNGKAVKAEGA